ncbi:LuxR C-terminal-related transcriptional regulator [Sphingobacterium sp. Mn56C]|uniref:LuxR C-terminal-related transcriptional regulator n=1 Tax=Sphingobacterium sp. Mn56C TaxID=3395261 RepID=UPI003BEDEB53
MKETKEEHMLSEVWERFGDMHSQDYVPRKGRALASLVKDILAIGPYYSYVIDVLDYSLHQVSDAILALHGLSDYPKHIKEILQLIHPDDQDFVLKAEEATLVKIQEIGFAYLLHFKCSYCFRMRMADGTYHMFHHQSIHLTKDKDGRLTEALNIHTDIQHIAPKNTKIVLVSALGSDNEYYQIDLSPASTLPPMPAFSKREMEVLQLLSQGYSSPQIADRLFIAPDTVRTHRKRLLRKSQTKNVGEFIRKCLEWGLL